MEVRGGNDDEAICAPASREGKSRLLRRAPHPASPLRTPRNDAVWTFSTVPLLWASCNLPFSVPSPLSRQYTLRTLRCQQQKTPLVSKRGLLIKSGSDLLSHLVAKAVPSTLRGLTSVFGMGTGVTLSLLPPGYLLGTCIVCRRESLPNDLPSVDVLARD